MKQLSMFGRADRARASRTAEIPEWMGRILWVRSRGELMKGAGHKYIRRVPTKNPPPRYRYFYSAGGGAGLGHADEIATGAAFKLSHGGQDGHFHVVAEGEGDTVRVRHDETGHEVEITRAALAAMLHREHASLVTAHAKRAAEDLHAVRRHGTDAQRARVEARVLRYQHTAHLAAPPASATKDGPAWRSAADGAGGAGLRILSLFSGAGGFDMGLHAALPHARTTGLCEIDPYARKVLARAFPGVAQHEDVNTLASGEDKPAERPNMIIGGFPCQDLSAANVRAKGLSGERSGLYRKMRDIIEGQNPDWVVFENVPLLRSRGLDVVLMDMQALGYEVTWDSISGASVGAPHQRDRVFVVCHRPGVKLDWQRPDREITGHHWQSDPPPLRDSGTHRQTRIAHTVLAGNAVIPQVAEHLGEIIGGSSPGQAEPTGKEIARWTGDAWVSPKGKPVVKFPRAGLLRDGVVYQNEHTKQDGGGIREGDKVWVRNTDSAGDGDVYDAEQRLALDHLTRNTTIPPAMQTTVDELVSWGIVDKTAKGYTLTAWGEHAVENMSQWTYDGQGGVNDAFLGRVHYVNGDSYDVELPNGDIEPFDEEYVRLMPTVVKSDWKGYGKADSENTPQYDTGRAGRDRGRQLMHWVDGYINPKFAEWHMGFPKGHFDVGQAPDDYKPIK